MATGGKENIFLKVLLEKMHQVRKSKNMIIHCQAVLVEGCVLNIIIRDKEFPTIEYMSACDILIHTSQIDVQLKCIN